MMGDKMLFMTRKEAKAEADKLVGWPTAKVSAIMAADGDSQELTRRYVIEVKVGDTVMYMRDNWYIR